MSTISERECAYQRKSFKLFTESCSHFTNFTSYSNNLQSTLFYRRVYFIIELSFALASFNWQI